VSFRAVVLVIENAGIIIHFGLPHVGAIACRCGGRDDEEHNIFCRTIAKAVLKVRRHMNALSGSEVYCVAGKFERRGAREHIEELACARMKVADLSGTRRHTLLNDTKIRALQKMPTVAHGSPGVVFGSRPINWYSGVWHAPILIERFFGDVRRPPGVLPPVVDGYVPAFTPFVRTGDQPRPSGRLGKEGGKPLCGMVGEKIRLGQYKVAAQRVARAACIETQ
jgi:hypothetical protein